MTVYPARETAIREVAVDSTPLEMRLERGEVFLFSRRFYLRKGWKVHSIPFLGKYSGSSGSNTQPVVPFLAALTCF